MLIYSQSRLHCIFSNKYRDIFLNFNKYFLVFNVLNYIDKQEKRLG